MFSNAVVYAVSGIDFDEIKKNVAGAVLKPCPPTHLSSVGWTTPNENDKSLVFMKGDQVLLAYGEEKRLLPSSVIKVATKKRVEEIESRQGYKVGKKQMKEIKTLVTEELLPKAFISPKKTLVWINFANSTLVVDASSTSKADDVVALLCKTFSGITLTRYYAQHGIVRKLTDWVLAGEVPGAFTVDRDCELNGQGIDDEKSVVRYSKHSLDDDNGGVRQHIEEGKLVTKLALTWNSRTSFIIDKSMCFKKIELLDIAKLDQDRDQYDDEFEADFLLFTGEFNKLWADWVSVAEATSELEEVA